MRFIFKLYFMLNLFIRLELNLTLKLKYLIYNITYIEVCRYAGIHVNCHTSMNPLVYSYKFYRCRDRCIEVEL